MQYFVRELADDRAVLIAEDGHPLSTFASVDDAVATCIVECRVAPLWIEWHGDSRVDDDHRLAHTLSHSVSALHTPRRSLAA